jgi:pimeloyl-ACP methyl ester carboxylesterase
MASYILLHGAWHGAWCWEKVIPLLKANGHKVFAPDLPGHGNDKTPLKAITFNSYIDCVRPYIERSDEQVILVGHSMAGVFISQLAEYYASKIRMLVYVTGFLPLNGESMLMTAQLQAPTRFVKMMKILSQENAFYFPVDAIKPFAYNRCNNALVEKLKPLFCTEPLSPANTQVRISDGKFGCVPRVYIECLDDRALLIETQRKMHARTPCTVYTLDCDHSPFYSDPDGLTEVLLAV